MQQELGADHGGGVTTVHEAAGWWGRSSGTQEQRATIAVTTAGAVADADAANFIVPDLPYHPMPNLKWLAAYEFVFLFLRRKGLLPFESLSTPMKLSFHCSFG
jgi:hypothetical protein